MFNNKKTRVALIGAAVVAMVAGVAAVSVANAATQSNGSDGPVYIGDSNSNALVPAGHTFDWTDDMFGFNDPTNVATPYVCPSDATGSTTFLAPTGQERTIGSWSATGVSLFAPANTKNVAQFNTSLYAQNVGNASAVKAAGGNYSVGLACTINNGVKLASSGVWFASVHITAVTGAYTVTQATGDLSSGTPPTTEPTTPPAGSKTATLNLKATTLASTDGDLGLTVPADPTVLIGSPVVDATTHLSVSTGTLGAITVADGRVNSHPGWTLTTSVTDFVNEGDATKSIPKAQLGFAPTVTSGPATAATAQTAGSAVYGSAFASADAASAAGTSVLNAALTFIAPASAAAGTYDSTLTLTLASK
jgi:hypothetical protein